MVPEPQGGRGQGDLPEENVDVLMRGKKVEKQHPPTVYRQHKVYRNTFQRVNRLEVLPRANRTLVSFS